MCHDEAVVDPALAHEFLVSSKLRQAALVKHDKIIRVAQCGKTVRNGYGRAIGDKLRQSLLDTVLGLGIERRGGLVKYKDTRIVKQGSGNGDPLTLAAGERVSPLADDGLVTVGQAYDKTMRSCCFRSGDDFLACAVR